MMLRQSSLQDVLAEMNGKEQGFQGKGSYEEEPILRTAAQLLLETPERIRQMRRISGYGSSGVLSMEARFLRQGQLMADFTDDYPELVPCSRAVPMYFNLRDAELRCFFTWRTRRRNGETPKTETAYLLLYCYELINQIGISSPEEGDECLRKLLEDYGAEHQELRKLLPEWIADYDALYRLPYQGITKEEQAMTAILRQRECGEEEFLRALDSFSKYHILKSKIYSARPRETELAVWAAYCALLRVYAGQKHRSFLTFLFGEPRRSEHILFEGAVYCVQRSPEEGAYRLSPKYVYHYYHGCWARETFCGEPDASRIGAMLRAVDSCLREKLHFPYPLRAEDLPPGDAEVIERAVEECLAEQKRRNAPKISLDSAKLEEIRRAANHTTEMLMLPEETAAPLEQEIPPAKPLEQESEGQAENPEYPLSKPAMRLLSILLNGESFQPLLEEGFLLTVLTEEINEALYDQFGDNVLETDEKDFPHILEDYLEEVKGLFAK